MNTKKRSMPRGGHSHWMRQPQFAVSPTLDRATNKKPNHGMYYCSDRRTFYSEDKVYPDTWTERDLEYVKTELKKKGFDPNRGKTGLSQVDLAIQDIKDWGTVSYAGPIAGYTAGLHKDAVNGDFLITSGPKLIVPKAGDFSTLDRVLTALLWDERQEQRMYFDYWMKLSYGSLRSGPPFKRGQALVLAGPVNSGKSFLQDCVITPILGGRHELPYQYFAGGTTFNGELVGTEHLKMEDVTAKTTAAERRELGNYIKQLVANRDHKFNPKYKQARKFSPFFRVTVSCNDEPAAVRVLPPMDESLKDKIMILKINGRGENSPCPPPKRTRKRSRRQLPRNSRPTSTTSSILRYPITSGTHGWASKPI